MTDDKPVRSPLVESPVRLEAKLEANATEAINRLVEAGINLSDHMLLPVGAAAADLVVSVLDVLRGPFAIARCWCLIKLAKLTKELQEAQGVTEPKPLPPEVQQLVLEKGSFVEDDAMRQRWAQLIVNAQAGVQFDKYLFDLLSQLSGADVQLLDKVVALRGQALRGDDDPSIAKLKALGLLERAFQVDVPHGRTVVETRGSTLRAELVWGGYMASDLGWILHKAASGPIGTGIGPRASPGDPPAR